MSMPEIVEKTKSTLILIGLIIMLQKKGNTMETVKCSSGNTLKYLDPALPVRQRVDDLISRMTLEEKAAQMVCVWKEKARTLVDEKGEFDLEKAELSFPHGLGQIGRLSDAAGGRSSRQNAGRYRRRHY